MLLKNEADGPFEVAHSSAKSAVLPIVSYRSRHEALAFADPVNRIGEETRIRDNVKEVPSKPEIISDGFLSVQLPQSPTITEPRSASIRYLPMDPELLNISHGISSLICWLTQRSARPIPDIGT
jgi:hypothetical protein